MARRRMRLGAFLRRRWRVAGLLVVGLLGALLLLAITDRGHDPLWRARAQHVDQVAISPGGERVYALVRDDPAGPLTRLEARSGLDGGLVWKTDLNDSRALVAAGDDRVVVATDYPRAFVTTFDADGTPRAPVPLGGNPRALVVDGGVTAVLVQGNDSRVLLLSEGAPPRELRFGVLAHAMDLRAGRLAVGTAAGDVLAFDALGTPMGNLSVGFQVRSLRLSGDGLSAALGGSRSDLTGAAALARLDSSPRVAWTVPTSAPVGLVDADDAMRRVVAVEETTPEATMRVLQASDGRQAWGKVVVGSVAGDDAGALGSVAVAPDGSLVVVGTLREGIRAYDAQEGALLWSYASRGSSVVEFRALTPPLFVANARLVSNGPFADVLLFSPTEEPASASLPLLAGATVAAGAALGIGVLGVGYWRVRRSY